ncbi:hypothetical protein AX14_008206 [Amanita brunnescens Koide BX004]|nr:hypothetical protein AX14_008206 [Amanita brunnescens Koide BX004]
MVIARGTSDKQRCAARTHHMTRPSILGRRTKIRRAPSAEIQLRLSPPATSPSDRASPPMSIMTCPSPAATCSLRRPAATHEFRQNSAKSATSHIRKVTQF